MASKRMLSKNDTMGSMGKGKIDNRINKSYIGDLDTINVTFDTLLKLYKEYEDNAPDFYADEEEDYLLFAVQDAIENLEHAIGDLIDYLSNPKYSASAKKSKSVSKASPYTLDWCGDKLSDALECLHDCFMSNYTASHHSFFDSILQQEYGLNTHTLIQAIRTLRNETRARRTPDYMASTRKSIKSDVEQFSAVVKSIRDRR